MYVVRDRLKINVNEGAMILEDSLITLTGIFSKTVALDGFNFLTVEKTISTRIGENFQLQA